MNKFTLLSLAKNTDTYKGCVWPGQLHKGFTDYATAAPPGPSRNDNTWVT